MGMLDILDSLLLEKDKRELRGIVKLRKLILNLNKKRAEPMIKKCALLIGASGSGTEYLPGVKKDIESYKKFLMSPYGGMWKEKEIIEFLDVKISAVRNALEKIKKNNFEFVFTIFSGHGNYDSEKKERRLFFDDENYLYESELLDLAPKQLVIIDCCAGIEEEVKPEAIFVEAKESLKIDYRKIYESYISQCPSQKIILYASSPGEYAEEIGKGGLYTVCLLETAYNNTEFKILTALRAHESASECVIIRSREEQTPDYRISRRSGDKLPFSLKVS